MNSSRPTTPSNYESEKREIVLALFAPSQMKINNNPAQKNKIIHRKEHRRWVPPAKIINPVKKNAKIKNVDSVTTVSVYKISDLSCRICNLFPENRRLKLSGCAVISKGIVVVEGGISSIKKYLKFLIGMKLHEKAEESVRVLWQGKAAKPSFGKFSILHCTNEVAAWKFFAAHGASHYWDLAVKST